MNENNFPNPLYKTIGQITKELGLINKKTGNLQTHTLRYWESQFKQIKPSIKAGKRRYYSKKDFELIKFIKYLLKEKGLTINGVKKILDKSDNQHIDRDINLGIYKPTINNTKIKRSWVNHFCKYLLSDK